MVHISNRRNVSTKEILFKNSFYLLTGQILNVQSVLPYHPVVHVVTF